MWKLSLDRVSTSLVPGLDTLELDPSPLIREFTLPWFSLLEADHPSFFGSFHSSYRMLSPRTRQSVHIHPHPTSREIASRHPPRDRTPSPPLVTAPLSSPTLLPDFGMSMFRRSHERHDLIFHLADSNISLTGNNLRANEPFFLRRRVHHLMSLSHLRYGMKPSKLSVMQN